MKPTTLAAFSLSLLLSVTTTPLALASGSKKMPTSSRSWIQFSATTHQSTYRSGQEIKVRLKAQNTHTGGAYLRFSSGQRFDFSVYPVGKMESVYTWSASRMFTEALSSLWIKPGQVEVFEETIGAEMGTLPPGKYELHAKLTRLPNPILAPVVKFEILPAN